MTDWRDGADDVVDGVTLAGAFCLTMSEDKEKAETVEFANMLKTYKWQSKQQRWLQRCEEGW